ncbi:2-oxo-heptane-1,7-dioate aldolase [Seminavis robusta]|uniref:2-oxo-heptane-1,7-dioate aldolase n=1 Tax=Seminavis robusta TaxID=568900 RepID=A0A9N8HSC3_9STRA|nr:2-oxo-heptane-1,7-dioate aldolase [Seminavis robusta]|eukprot:Sro1425_g271590.1 2-oxo-heptane-1,7-dioate aldolase (278) ;mRNA; r:18083-18916
MISLRQRLLQGGRSYGPLIMSDSRIIAELLAGVGYDHLLVDMEHSPTNPQSAQRLLQAMDAAAAFTAARTTPLVRLADNQDPASMKLVLDSMRLPGGVLVPMVEDAKTAERVVQSTRYPTQQSFPDHGGGIRGCAVPFVRASGYGMTHNNDEYLRQCREDLLVMVQVESPQGVDAIPEIAAVEGVDLIFLGPFDLSCSAGKMGQFQDSDIQQLIAQAEQAVVQSPSCLLGGFQTPGVELKDMFDEKGYSLVCGAVDLGLLRQAALADCAKGKTAMGE